MVKIYKQLYNSRQQVLYTPLNFSPGVFASTYIYLILTKTTTGVNYFRLTYVSSRYGKCTSRIGDFERFFFQLGIFFGYATAAGINKSFLFKIKKANVCEMFGYGDSVGYLFDCGLYKTGKVFQC